MKRRGDYTCICIFMILLLILSGFEQVRDEVGITFSYKKLIFYYYFFFPAAYLTGGYLLGRLLLWRGRIELHTVVKKTAMLLVVLVMAVHMVLSVLSVIDVFWGLLPSSAAAEIANCLILTYKDRLLVFSVLGLVSAFCISSSFREDTLKTNFLEMEGSI